MKLGNLEIPSLVMFGDQADFVRVAIDEWLQLRQKVSLMKQGVPKDKIQTLAPFFEELTELQSSKNTIEVKQVKTEDDLQELEIIVGKLNSIGAKMLAKSPEMADVAFGFSTEIKEELKGLEEKIIEQRKEITKSILGCLDPVIDIQEFNNAKISSLQKELFIYEVAKDPENNMDASFLAVMERQSPQLLTLSQTF
jgi:hypothetical protein